jgi:hypothetical protein
MSLIRLIFYSIIAYFVIRFIRKFLGGRPGESRPRLHVAGKRTSQMVRCESCGTFVAETRALVLGNKEFCSKACAETKRT